MWPPNGSDRGGRAVIVATPRAELAAWLGARLADVASAGRAFELATEQVRPLGLSIGRPGSLAQGHAGLALFFACLAAQRDDADWPAAGHAHLEAASRALARRGGAVSLADGLAGLGVAAVALSHGGRRYGRLLAAVDEAVLPAAAAAADRLGDRSGYSESEYDLISGATGIGAYLLLRRGAPDVDAVLPRLLAGLASLCQPAGDGPPRWHTPPGRSFDPALRARFPAGHYNLGLAHGLPGLLALLAIAMADDVVAGGLAEGLAAGSAWLVAAAVDDGRGRTWPSTLPLEGGGPEPAASRPMGRLEAAAGALRAVSGPEPAASRPTWCYGTGGVTHALLLAGQALGDRQLVTLAVDSLDAALERPEAFAFVPSPTFCHGVAGITAIVAESARRTGDERLGARAARLAATLVGRFDPELPLGWRSVHRGGMLVDHPGLLDGAPGTAAVLCALGGPVPLAYRRAFLLA